MASISGDFSTNLVAHWEFENNGEDSTANNKDLTLANSPSYVTGKIGSNAISFNGTNQYASIGSFAYSNPFTINLWVNERARVDGLGNPATANVIIYSSVDYCEVVSDNGNVTFAGAGNAWVDTGIDLTLQTWTMLTFVNTTSGLDVYANGTKVYDGADYLDPLTGTFYLGTWKNQAGWAEIYLDAVSVWSSTLSGTDISTLYNSGTGIPYSAASTSWTPKISFFM